jgi:hypothetical protein
LRPTVPTTCACLAPAVTSRGLRVHSEAWGDFRRAAIRSAPAPNHADGREGECCHPGEGGDHQHSPLDRARVRRGLIRSPRARRQLPSNICRAIYAEQAGSLAPSVEDPTEAARSRDGRRGTGGETGRGRGGAPAARKMRRHRWVYVNLHNPTYYACHSAATLQQSAKQEDLLFS